jgi:hypothetical protein
MRCIYINGETKTAEEVIIDTRWMDEATAQRFVLRWLKNKGEYEDLGVMALSDTEHLWYSDDQHNADFPMPVSFVRVDGSLIPVYGDMLIASRKPNGYLTHSKMTVEEAQSLVARPRKEANRV